MSDDDLWRRPQEPPSDDADQDADQDPAEPVSDETQPITGTSSTPSSPPPPSPSYDSPSGPIPPPPDADGYGSAPTSGRPHPGQPGPPGQPGWNPYVDPNEPHSAYGPAPTTPYPQGGGYGQGPGFAPPPNPYPPPHEYGAPQNPYGSPYLPAYAGGLVPNHPSATTSMVLGIVGLVSIVVCAGVLLILSPAAWVLGAKAVREIDASPGRYGGRDRAQAGKVMGIIGSVLLILGILLIILLVVIAVSASPDPQPINNNQNF